MNWCVCYVLWACGICYFSSVMSLYFPLRLCLDSADESHFIRFCDDKRAVRGSALDLDGTAFMVVGLKLLECHQGPNHRRCQQKVDSEVD